MKALIISWLATLCVGMVDLQLFLDYTTQLKHNSKSGLATPCSAVVTQNVTFIDCGLEQGFGITSALRANQIQNLTVSTYYKNSQSLGF